MATRITCHLPADEFALDRTLGSVPGLSLVCERVAASGDEVVTPLIRFRFHGTDLAPLENALSNDPTVDRFDILIHENNGTLCYVHWNNRVHILVRMLTVTDALVLSGTAEQERWTFDLLFPTREALSQLNEFCTKHNLSLNVDSVETWDGNSLDPTGMTTEQHEALSTAYEHGYFKVPREIVLDDVAAEIGISHQALSERLRRGHDTLIKRVLNPTTIEPETKPDSESHTRSEMDEGSVILPYSQPSTATID